MKICLLSIKPTVKVALRPNDSNTLRTSDNAGRPWGNFPNRACLNGEERESISDSEKSTASSPRYTLSSFKSTDSTRLPAITSAKDLVDGGSAITDTRVKFREKDWKK
ncbi:hypothetical protein LguiB_003497 [Lonicera macranthoides]